MGRLSNKEKELIYEDFVAVLTEDTICTKYNRPLTTIQEAIKTISGKIERKKTKTIIIDSVGELKSKHFWPELQKQLTDIELEYFAESWGKLVKQFSQYAILETDEMIMKDLVVHDVLINRNLSQKKSLMIEIDFYEKELTEEFKKEPRDQQKITYCHNKLSNARSSLSDLERVHDTLQKRKDQKFRDMKATRDLRYKQIEDSKKTWFEMMKELDAYNVRQKEGEWLAYMKKSVDKEEDRLSEFHQFADGEFDQILLNEDTVKDKNS